MESSLLSLHSLNVLNLLPMKLKQFNVTYLLIQNNKKSKQSKLIFKNKLMQLNQSKPNLLSLTNKDGRNKDGKAKKKDVVTRKQVVKIKTRDGIRIKINISKKKDKRPINNSNKSHNHKENGEMINSNNKNQPSQNRLSKSNKKYKRIQPNHKNNKKIQLKDGEVNSKNKKLKSLQRQNKEREMVTNKLSQNLKDGKENGKVENKRTSKTKDISNIKESGEETIIMDRKVLKTKSYDRYELHIE